MDKTVPSAAHAVADIKDGATLSVAGFGVSGVPSALIAALLDSGVTDLEGVSFNFGTGDWGLGLLLAETRLRRMLSSYAGGHIGPVQRYRAGALELELVPQSTLIDRVSAGSAQAAARLSALLHDGPLSEDDSPTGCGNVTETTTDSMANSSNASARERLGDEAIVIDFGLVRAWKGDRLGNLVYREPARRSSILAAMCGRCTIAEVDELVEVGELDPSEVDTPGAQVHRVIGTSPAQGALPGQSQHTTRVLPGYLRAVVSARDSPSPSAVVSPRRDTTQNEAAPSTADALADLPIHRTSDEWRTATMDTVGEQAQWVDSGAEASEAAARQGERDEVPSQHSATD